MSIKVAIARSADELHLAMSLPLTAFTFPGGERHVKVVLLDDVTHAQIFLDFKGSDDIIDLMLLCDVLDANNIHKSLVCRYFPFARQDRRASAGEPFALSVFAKLIVSLKFSSITYWDAHSHALMTELCANHSNTIFRNIKQDILAKETFEEKLPEVLNNPNVLWLAPDAGAARKIAATAVLCRGDDMIRYAVGQKKRCPHTGAVSYIGIDNFAPNEGDIIVVADDICDGGATFIALAILIEQHINYKNNKLVLYVTHGIFSKGMEHLKEHYDVVVCANPLHFYK